MRLPLVYATLVAGPLSILFLAAPTAAQQPAGGGLPARPAGPAGGAPVAAAPAPAAVSGCNIVVMDVAYIFKFHQRFKSRMDEVKQAIEQYDAYIRGEQQRFNTEREKLSAFNPGSKEFKEKEEALAKTKTELEVKMQQKRREFMDQEARVYFETYREIEEEVKVFAQQQRIDMVLRFNRDEMKADDRNSVLAGVNRAVIFQQNRDITDLILQRLNVKAPPAPTGNQVAPGTQTANPRMPGAPIIPQTTRPAPGTLK